MFGFFTFLPSSHCSSRLSALWETTSWPKIDSLPAVDHSVSTADSFRSQHLPVPTSVFLLCPILHRRRFNSECSFVYETSPGKQLSWSVYLFPGLRINSPGPGLPLVPPNKYLLGWCVPYRPSGTRRSTRRRRIPQTRRWQVCHPEGLGQRHLLRPSDA